MAGLAFSLTLSELQLSMHSGEGKEGTKPTKAMIGEFNFSVQLHFKMAVLQDVQH